MASERSCRGEFTKLVADHLLGDVDRNMFPAVMHGDGVPHHLREYGGGARPGLQDAVFIFLILLVDALEQPFINEKSFFSGI